MIYRLAPDVEKYDAVVLINERDVRAYNQFDGRPLADAWRSPAVALDPGGNPADFMSFLPGSFVVSDKARVALRSILGRAAELLPLDCAEGPFFAVNVLETADCLDRSRSIIDWLPSGAVAGVESYEFKQDCIGDRTIFRLPETRQAEILLSDKFKSAVIDSGLTGLLFEPVGKVR